jgi:6-phosphogluconolactonase (cycloisomerase 2 family)
METCGAVNGLLARCHRLVVVLALLSSTILGCGGHPGQVVAGGGAGQGVTGGGGGSSQSASRLFAYVINDDKTVSQFQFTHDGNLTPLTPPILSGSIRLLAITADPSAHAVYVTAANDTVSQFHINPDGTLVPLGQAQSTVPYLPTSVVVTPNGRYAYVANSVGSGYISQFGINGDGSLSPLVPSAVPIDPSLINPRSMVVTPDGQFVYVACEGTGDPESTPARAGVAQFRISGTGELTPLTPPFIEPDRPLAVSVTISSNSKFAYVVTKPDSQIFQFRIEPDGHLTATLGRTVNPRTYLLRPALAPTPDGRSIYMVTTARSFVAQYGLDADGGLIPLSPLTVPSGSPLRAITLSPDGRFAYAISVAPSEPLASGPGGIWQYRIGGNDELAPMSIPNVVTGHAPLLMSIAPS